MIMTKITVPNMPVTALKGISDLVNVRARISTAIIKTPPKVMQRGIDLLVSLPTISLTICGITKPIQLTTPLNATEVAVNSVAIPIIKNL